LNKTVGVGRYVKGDNCILEGHFVNGRLTGYARVIGWDGTFVLGQYRDGKKHGLVRIYGTDKVLLTSSGHYEMDSKIRDLN